MKVMSPERRKDFRVSKGLFETSQGVISHQCPETRKHCPIDKDKNWVQFNDNIQYFMFMILNKHET